jgi:4-azaleucine resistance transporter AzlC
MENSENLTTTQIKGFRQGIRDSLPIVTGYVPIAIAYGVLGVKSGIPASAIVAMSIFIYGGASQFMAITLFLAGTAPIEMAIATGMLNIRHFVMELSFHKNLKAGFQDKVLTSLGLTDETFAFLALESSPSPDYSKGVMLSSYLSWIGGTVIGALSGNFIPEVVSKGMSIGLYTLFITLLVSALRGKLRLIFIPLTGMLVNSVFSRFLSPGMSILISITLASLIGAWFGGESIE